MGDIRTVWNVSRGDWDVSGPDLESGRDLETAVIISLFTDRLANGDDVLPSGDDPRGWVGDLGQPVKIGSRLWLLERAKLSLQTGAIAKSMAAEALQWLIDDGVVAKFEIITEVLLPSRLNMQIIAFRHDGSKQALNFSNTWS